MNYLNTCFLEGHLTADAENRKAGNGIITSFGIAQNRNYINSKNELVKETSFFNVEVWGEVTSTSNCTDYQARALKIKYKDEKGKTEFLHTLNGTAIAISRAVVAILENYQNEDGSVDIPSALLPYMCGIKKIPARNK